MASKIVKPWGSFRSLAIRSRPSRPHHVQTTRAAPIARRCLTDDTHMKNYSNGEDPESIPPWQRSPQDRKYSPYPVEPFADNFMNTEAIEALKQAAAGEDLLLATEGLKFHMPRPTKKHEQLQDRDHPVIHQVTRMLMRDGKLSKAQKHVSLILNYLRTSPAPQVSPLRPLLPGSPPPEQLPLNPLLYLTLAIDSVAPIVRVRSLKGLAGGGNALDVPGPINARSRRQQAIQWILDVVNRKPSMGSGRKQFAARFGSEIIAVVEGRSSVWERRQALHKLATTSRANISHPGLLGKRKK
ncbi:ribosomal protein S7 domain-containing protein [Xylaria intraflava]|nr:ribosomal protein S7 domain-containing protein [Xylaria intraflava]